MARRARPWACRACKARNAVGTRRCSACLTARPKKRVAAHNKALDLTYEQYVALNEGSEACGICGKERGERRHHRDHDHRLGIPRGILCFRCNAAVRTYVTLDWARRLVRYLERASQTEENQ